MISNLLKWYSIAMIDNISEDMLEKRSSAIQDMQHNDEAFCLNCIRLYLGKKVGNKEFNHQFFTGFNSKDVLYTEDAPLLEKRILAGAIVAQMFTDDNKFGNQLAYALVCGTFGIADTELINKDIIVKAKEYLHHRAETERILAPIADKAPTFKEKTLHPLATSETAVNSSMKKIVDYMAKQIKHCERRIDRLQEESDIHWWLFRSYSNLRSVPVTQLPPKQAPFILAYELSELMTIVPAPHNSTSFLNKILKEIPDLPTAFSIKQTAEVLVELNSDFANALDNNRYENLTPLIFSVSQRAETEGDDAWTVLFNQRTKVDTNFTCTTQEIALQFLNELILLSIR